MKLTLVALSIAVATVILFPIPFAMSDEGITQCFLEVHGITAINGKCFVKTSATKVGEKSILDLHAEVISAYRYRQAHKKEKSLPLGEQHCKGPWINITKEDDSYSAYWGEGCHGGETVETIAIGRNHYRGKNYEFNFTFGSFR